ncbi:hypothetical protein KSP39_PZI014012 [Platanthera zijinensis]|uniref:AARP2CN domain-containing protein n=1 Tax=Platanthera zijinensis TaxID=2320716 RepID=A0AAP0BDC2_9ASPA
MLFCLVFLISRTVVSFHQVAAIFLPGCSHLPPRLQPSSSICLSSAPTPSASILSSICKVDLEVDNNMHGKCTLLLSGYLRGRNLSVNQLVHVSGAGDFQFDKIDVLMDPVPLNDRKYCNSMDSDKSNYIKVCLAP